jgi:hypothetical protein
MLRAKYGWEGEGKFWALNNMIAKAEDCKLNIGNKYNLVSIAVDLNFTKEEFLEFIAYLVDECCLVTNDDNFLSTNTTQETLEEVMGNRKRAKERKQRNIEKYSKGYNENTESSGEPTENLRQTFNKESKESKESKVKRESKESSHSPFSKNGKTSLKMDWFENNIWKPWPKKNLSKEEAVEIFISAAPDMTEENKPWYFSASQAVLNYSRSKDVSESVIMNFETFFIKSKGANVLLWDKTPPN